jgi:hypothetical protein
LACDWKLCNIAYFLGLEIFNTSKGIIVHQAKYALNMMDCNSAITPSDTILEVKELRMRRALIQHSSAKLIDSLRYFTYVKAGQT